MTKRPRRRVELNADWYYFTTTNRYGKVLSANCANSTDVFAAQTITC